MSSFYVQNFGCRATQADGAVIDRQLCAQGMVRASPQLADVVVLNTCTVTAAADRDARATIRRLHRQNPACRILVTGCYAQRAPQELAALPGVNWVVGNSHKHQVAYIVASGAKNENRGFVPLSELVAPASLLVGDIFAHTQLMAAPVFEDRGLAEKTRPILKVQDGCNNRCSFCIIPQVRGHSRSLPLDQILCEVAALVAAGYREIVISGINLGRWGRDLDPPLRFEHLVRAILASTAIERLRLSSIEPMDWSNNLIELMAASQRIAKHAHVPLQSGSDQVLRRMHRKYRPWHYRQRIESIRQLMPAAAIGADVMVAFPGETDFEFEETRSLIEQLPFTYLHIFTFSPRPGTPAAATPNQVPPTVAGQRSRTLRELIAKKKIAFQRSFIGQTLPAITLAASDSDSTQALTDNYLPLRLAGKHAPNQWIQARIHAVNSAGMLGTLAAAGNGDSLRQ